MTAHAAKGLEFQHVAIVRGSSISFPCPYREPLVAFPAELRRSDAVQADDKTLHEEEERRLFYVAMTRAKDTLAIYANAGKSKSDPKPTKFLREFMVHPGLQEILVHSFRGGGAGCLICRGRAARRLGAFECGGLAADGIRRPIFLPG